MTSDVLLISAFWYMFWALADAARKRAPKARYFFMFVRL